jgi:hypothetical protein
VTDERKLDEAVRRVGYELVRLGRRKIQPDGSLQWSVYDFSRHNITIPAILSEYRRIIGERKE